MANIDSWINRLYIYFKVSNLTMLLIILLSVCLVLLITNFWKKTYNYWQKKNIIQVGDLNRAFMFGNCSLPEICKSIYDKHNVPYIGTSLGTTPALILKNSEDIQEVFAGNFQSFYSRGLRTNPNDILADNLLFTDDFQKWQLMRQKLSPVFTSLRLKNMFYIIDECACDFVKFVETNEDLRDNPFNILYTYTTSSIAASVFGIDTQTKNSTMDSPFLDMAKKALEPTLKRNIFLFISNICPKLFQILKLKFFGDYEKFFVGVVKQVLESRKHNNLGRRYDFIEICLELQKNGTMENTKTGYKLEPTDELLAAQAFFFFIAGADTTANSMHFTLLELAANPKVLEKLHQEIDNMFDSCTEKLTYNGIDKLEYLDMVISESMRKYPPIGYIQRLCTKNTVLPSNVEIEKDTIVAIPVLAIHRDGKHFPKPDEFDPERFKSNNAVKIKKFTYLPFGEGNRICIGARFARLQIKAGLAQLLRRYTLAEQNYSPKLFDRSSFGLRDPKARYDFIPRNI